MARSHPLAGTLLLIAAGTAMLAATIPPESPAVHERKEVAGLAIVFGAEPEPALTEEMQALRWRVTSLDTEEPYAEMEDATVTVTFAGEEFGPFPVRASRRDPGQYQTQHIFTAAGEYTSVLEFRKGDEAEVHTVDFTFRIRDRSSLEIPGRRGGR